MAQSNGGRMLAFVQGREKARLGEQARKNISPRGNAPLSAEERARIARDLRFPNAGGLHDRSGSPHPQRTDSHARRPADNDLAAVLPQRGTRGRSTFDSEYTESVSSVSGFADQRDATVHQREPGEDQAANAPHEDDARGRHYGHADALDGDAPSEDERPQSRASDFSRIDRQAQRILEENRARRLRTAAMSHQDDDSYPATTSGRISTPEPFADPVRVHQFSPLPAQQGSRLHERHRPADLDEDSVNAHKATYMRQSAEQYQKQHAGPLTDPAVVQAADPKTASTIPHQPHAVRTTNFLDFTLGDKELLNPSAFPFLTAAVDDDSLLDYTPDVLHKMTFDALQEESFDFDPGAKDNSASAIEDASLPDRLAAAMDLDAPARRELLKTIPQSNWDAVDAWFSEQFADLARQRTQKRVEQRAIAREFEEQVAQRFAEVNSEREELRKALEEMKQSGANVLKVGTPTPKRKRAAA